MSVESKKTSPLDYLLWIFVAAALVAAVWGNDHYTDDPNFPWYFRLAGVVLLALAAVGLALLTRKGKYINQLRKESLVEIKKVIWPNRQETTQTTLVVIVATVIVAIMIAVMDWVLSSGMSALLNLNG